MSVGFYVIHDKRDCVAIVGHQVEMLQDFNRFLFQHPVQQSVNIFKMIVKGLPVYPAVIDNLSDGYLRERLVSHDAFQRSRQGPFRLHGCDFMLHLIHLAAQCIFIIQSSGIFAMVKALLLMVKCGALWENATKTLLCPLDRAICSAILMTKEV